MGVSHESKRGSVRNLYGTKAFTKNNKLNKTNSNNNNNNKTKQTNKQTNRSREFHDQTNFISINVSYKTKVM